ncbi:hypothetical protein QFC22_001915 [Naganishia vaughanmartiniae]|uniref:Uncharacterized protein n=1 Tax=Naganishia vaughanmartiniae TaxID=1424756 RepID=A0ACC2XGU5_9TREE|nr:hypothetical protein QFC22_001915 [Naganishia vaughanmartiniae]
MSQVNPSALNRKGRRRRPLTSALNNPELFNENATATASSPASTSELLDTASRANGSSLTAHATPPSQSTAGRKRKRKRTDTGATGASLGVSVSAPSDIGLASKSAHGSRNGHAGLSSVAASRHAIVVSGTGVANVVHGASSSLPSVQQQFQERGQLLAERESNTKLEAQLKTLGKEVQFKNELKLQGSGTDIEAEDAPAIISAADRVALWDNVFKPVTNRSWYIDDEDLGVRRCGTCGHEIEGRNCSHCDEHFSDLSDEDSYDDYSEDESLMLRHPINHGFLHARWPGEDSEEDDFSDEDGWNGVDEHRHGQFALGHLRGLRPANRFQPMDFEFGFQEGVLENGSGGEEPESDGASFNDDEDMGLARHFGRGYEFDGEDDDDEGHEDDEDGRDAFGMEAIEWVDRHGRPTRIGGRAVGYSPSVGSSHGTFHSAGSESMGEDAEGSALENNSSRRGEDSDDDTSAREDWGPVRRPIRRQRHNSGSPATSNSLGSIHRPAAQPRQRRIVRIVSDED